MADEIKYSGLGDMRVAAILSKEVEFLLSDPNDLMSTMVEKKFDAKGSLVLHNPKVSANAVMAASGEVTQTANTALVDASYDLTFAHYRLVRELSDSAVLTAPGASDVALLAELAVRAVTQTVGTMLTALFPSLATSVGTSGVDMSVDDMFSGIYSLQSALVSGPFHMVLHPVQWNDLQASLRAEQGNAIAFQPATAEAIALKGPGYKGQLFGVEVWTADSCTSSGGNRRGAIYGEGAFAYGIAPIAAMAQIPGIPLIGATDRVAIEIGRKPDYGSSLIVSHAFLAVSEAEDLRGVLISTDA